MRLAFSQGFVAVLSTFTLLHCLHVMLCMQDVTDATALSVLATNATFSCDVDGKLTEAFIACPADF